MTFPTVHMNGTSRDALTEDYRMASLALAAACRALQAAAPNGRDYYIQGRDAWQAAWSEHASRMERLVDVRTELEAILDHLAEQDT